MLENCPDGFKAELEAIIDDIESTAVEIECLLAIECPGDMHQIESAHNLAAELSSSLY